MPHLIKCVLYLIDERGNGAKLHGVQVVEALRDFSKVLVDDLGLATEVLVLLAAVVFALVFLPELNFISGSEYALDIFLVVV